MMEWVASFLMPWVTSILILCGAGFMLLAATGIVRLPDIWMRMHSSTKSATLGIGFMQMALVVSFLHDLGVVMRAIIIIGFIFQTAPIAAHMIGRAAYLMKLPLWEKTVRNELKGQYCTETFQVGNVFESREERPH